jgi:hypothetical protein
MISTRTLRQELLDSIHEELVGHDDLLAVIEHCLALMGDAQLGELRMSLSRPAPQSVSSEAFRVVIADITRLLRATGKHLSDDEYREFVSDVLARLEHSEVEITR